MARSPSKEERLREMALGMLVNSEMIYSVRPWILTNECDYWFTKAKSEVRPLRPRERARPERQSARVPDVTTASGPIRWSSS